MFLMKEKDKVHEAKFILYLVHRTFLENVASYRFLAFWLRSSVENVAFFTMDTIVNKSTP